MDFATAKQTIFDLLAAEDGTPVSGLTEVTQVYLGEPRAGALATPVSVTVTSSSMDAYTIEITVRVYVKPDPDASVQQAVLDATVEEVERLLDDATAMEFARGTWTLGYNATIDSLVAACPVSCSRSDF